MSEYRFAEITKVPNSVVNQIVLDFTREVIATVEQSEEPLTQQQIINVIFETKNKFCGSSEHDKIYRIGDYTLTQDQVNTITEYMRTEQKVAAVREFRNSTGCSLTEARDIICDYFNATPTGAQRFLNHLHLSA